MAKNSTLPPVADASRSFWHGVKTGIPIALVVAVMGISFGVFALGHGFTELSTIAFSALIFGASFQFTVVGIISAGGGLGAALTSGALLHSRFLPMGVAMAPSLPGRALWRLVQGQSIVDASWATASRGDGTFDRHIMFGSSAVQYIGWVGGTVIGVLAGSLIGDTNRFGFDAIFPAFVAWLLVAELRDKWAVGVAIAGTLIAFAMIPITPPGAPVLIASLAALVGLRRQIAVETGVIENEPT